MERLRLVCWGCRLHRAGYNEASIRAADSHRIRPLLVNQGLISCGAAEMFTPPPPDLSLLKVLH
jgi:hypothetical protein